MRTDLDDLSEEMARAGITRLGEITGLDSLGIPVFTSYRPWSRSLSVSQGKGLTRDQARASAAFEAIELFAAEMLPINRHTCSDRLAAEGERVLDTSCIPRRLGHEEWDSSRWTNWVRAVDVFSNEIVWVPWRLVCMDFSVDTEALDKHFIVSSNGLASGRTFADAFAHALAEAIERDATSWFFAATEEEQRRRRVIFDDMPTWLVDVAELVAGAGLGFAVWDATSFFEVPVFVCLIADTHPNELRPIAAAAGMGCHPSKDIALIRAVTEAAQSRLTFIAGCRDDLRRRDFERMCHLPDLVQSASLVCDEGVDGRQYTSIPSAVGQGASHAAECLLRRLMRSGFDEVLVVDVPTHSPNFSVVKVIVPGLIDNSGFHADYDFPFERSGAR